MILLIHDRDDNLHLCDYTSLSGNKFTLCNLVYCKKDIITTLALDNTPHNICRTCRDNYTTMYRDDLFFDSRTLHSTLDFNVKRILNEATFGNGDLNLKIKYQDYMDRNDIKTARYQRKISRK